MFNKTPSSPQVNKKVQFYAHIFSETNITVAWDGAKTLC